jgi:hypothetical protein
MDHVRQLPVGSERVTTDSFSRWPATCSHVDLRDLAERPFLSRAKAKRVAPIFYQVEILRCKSTPLRSISMASADALVWAANQILAASDRGMQAAQSIRFAPCRLLIAVTRAAGSDEYKPLNSRSTDFKVRGDTPSAAKTMHRPPTNVLGTAAGLAA